MVSFEKLFFESKAQPIQYNGATLYLADRFPVSNGDTLVICIESTNSPRIQGVSVNIEGSCEIMGEIHKKGKMVKPIFWEDSEKVDPKHIEIKVFTKKGYIFIQNICEVEYSYLVRDESGMLVEVRKKRMDASHNGAAMIVEEIEGGRRYLCSDTNSSEKPFPFNDIVFTVTCNPLSRV
jgi:hypothetical protein